MSVHEVALSPHGTSHRVLCPHRIGRSHPNTYLVELLADTSADGVQELSKEIRNWLSQMMAVAQQPLGLGRPLRELNLSDPSDKAILIKATAAYNSNMRDCDKQIMQQLQDNVIEAMDLRSGDLFAPTASARCDSTACFGVDGEDEPAKSV